ncbi:MAG: hypothetical protein M3Z03_07230 [Actinomycetota bacterium]|nr:hypothetical protein [Actinomycetota bacterium]
MAALPRFVNQPTASQAHVVQIQEETVCEDCDRDLPVGSSMIWDPIGRSLTCRACQLAEALRAAPVAAAQRASVDHLESTPRGRTPARPLLTRVTNAIWGEPPPDEFGLS